MNCSTGLDLIATFILGKNMTDLHAAVCDLNFHDYIKFLPTAQAQEYTQAICTLAATHVNHTFTEFQNDFCANASQTIKSTALEIHNRCSALLPPALYVSAIASIALALLGNKADDTGHSSIGFACRAFSVISIIGGPIIGVNWLLRP